MILFDHEVYIDFANSWRFRDEDGDLYFTFQLFGFTIFSTGFGITLFNFTLVIAWY
jgi:hypothetical protein